MNTVSCQVLVQLLLAMLNIWLGIKIHGLSRSESSPPSFFHLSASVLPLTSGNDGFPFSHHKKD